MTEASIICDSISPRDERLTTFIATMPRYVLAELNTHRAFSRNAASSRAIPVKKRLAAVRDEPVMPAKWGSNQPGMQAGAELEGDALTVAQGRWLWGRDRMLECAESLMEAGLAKEIANRPLECWAHVTVLITATDWDNFFALRAHQDAQPEFRELAFKMLALYNEHRPTPKQVGEWHIPFGDTMPSHLSEEDHLKIAVARAARLSYLTFEGGIDITKDIQLHDRLLASGHMSPFEHPAKVAATAGRYGNFSGWQQYRHGIAGQNKTDPRVRKWTFAEAST